MANRHNLCINPCLTNNDTGWTDGGAEAPSRTTVTGFVRSFGARYTTNSVGFIRTPQGAVSAGLTYTLSIYIKPTNTGNGTIYAEWLNSGGGVLSYTNNSYSATGGVVTRISHTATAPTNAAFVRIITDGINFSVNTTDFTAVLIEEAATALTYFDGDSPGGSWDGTAGNSASTLSTDVSGTGAAPLGGLTATASGVRTVSGVTASALGALTATAIGTPTVLGTANAAFGVAATIIGHVSLRGTANALLGALTATATVAAAAQPGATGNWDTLLAITKEARALAAAEQSRQPTACPNDGEPLQRHRGVLHCAYDGWAAP